MLTPAFGTAQPPRGLSGAIRKLAYRRYSEGRAAHWLLLIAADRVNVYESFVTGFLTGHPDNLLTETGVRAEVSGHGLSSRVGQNRSDVVHHAMDPHRRDRALVIGGLGGVVAYRQVKKALSRSA